MARQFVCQHCGSEFWLNKVSRNRKYFFCSPSCRNKARALKFVPCPVCKKEFKPRRINGAGKPPKRYCSQECARIGRRGKKSKKATPDAIKELIKQIYPKYGPEPLVGAINKSRKAIQIIATKMGVRLDSNVYRARVHDAAQKRMTGAKNPNWKGGVTTTEWGSNWIKQRRAALRRDNKTCQSCNGVGKSVHHIKPRKLFIGHMEDANELSNLITLCASCHIRVEMGKIPCPTVK